MSHDITTSLTVDGAALYSCVTVRQPAWHMLGANFANRNGLTVDEALTESYQNFTVQRVPLTTTIKTTLPTGDTMTETLPVPNQYATIRPHPVTGEIAVLGTVGSRYRVLQNHDAYRFAQDLIGEHGANIVSAGGLNGDRRTFVTLSLPRALTIGGTDPIDLYLVLTNSHDGSTALTCAVTPVRVVCANTERLALAVARHKWTTRHTAGVNARLDEARRTLRLAETYADAFTAAAEHLLAQPFSVAQFDTMSRALLPDADAATPRQAARLAEQRTTLRQLFTDAGTQTNIRGTRWAAYNAVTEWADWGPLRGPHAHTRRATRTLTDTPTIKTRAADYLLAA